VGWPTVVLGAFLGFGVGAVVGVVVVLARRTSLKTAVPFGPSMLAGAWLALAFGGGFLDWYSGG
jgi:leader peptidase (prepilin peptidase)/N-methyltransferase